MKTGFQSVRLALAGFIVPYMFVYNNELLLINTTPLAGIRVAITAVIGVFLISGACEGYLYRKIAAPIRVIMMAGAVLLIASDIYTDIAGIIVFAAILLFQKALAKKDTPATA